MDERAIREFVNRRWREVADAKTAFWGGRFAQDRHVSWRAAQALLDHVRRVRPGFPDEREREADRANHLTLRAASSLGRTGTSLPIFSSQRRLTPSGRRFDAAS